MSARSAQLRLVTEAAPAHGVSQDPVRQVFEHWVFMFGLMPARTKLDPERRQVITAALQLYEGDVQLLLQAVEGMAAAPLGDKPQSMQDSMREITWFLARSKRIESALRWSDKLRDALELQAHRAAAPVGLPQDLSAADKAAAQAGRDRLRALAQQVREGLAAHG